MRNVRLIVILVVAVLILIVILQNMEPVSTRILFVTVTMPRAALLFVTLVVGFIIGLIVAITGAKHRKGRSSGAKTPDRL
jgi:putative membrane protein